MSHAEISLVRRRTGHGLRGWLRRHPAEVVLFQRSFTPRTELDELEHYATTLERVAEHANSGSLGCFVETQADRGAVVSVALYERWFDGERLRCDQLAIRTFDPDDETSLVSSAEFLAVLQDWAERQNDEREASYLEHSAEEASRSERVLERQSAATELESILRQDSADSPRRLSVVPQRARYRAPLFDADDVVGLWSWFPMPIGLALLAVGLLLDSLVLLVIGAALVALRIFGALIPRDWWW